MTDEEIEQKSNEYCKQLEINGFPCGTCLGDCEYAYGKNESGFVKVNDFFDYVNRAYKDGYKQCTKDIDVLTKELKSHCKAVDDVNAKLKCCGNCNNGLRNGLLCDRQIECRRNNYKLWELAE